MTHDQVTKPDARGDCVAKLIGTDAELGNFILGITREQGTGREASRALLEQIDGVRATVAGGGRQPAGRGAPGRPVPHLGSLTDAAEGSDPRDVDRTYLASNGGCVYIDLDHLEVCTPEVVSAFDFVAAWHAMLGIARQAMRAANATRPREQRIVVLVNSSDGRGNSYGNHINVLVTRRLWNDLFVRSLHPYLFVLIAHQVSSIVYTGQGKVGAENGRPDVRYQVLQIWLICPDGLLHKT